MRWFRFVKLFGWLLVLFLEPVTGEMPLAIAQLPQCSSNLPLAIERVIHRPQFRRSRWGIAIKTLYSQRTLYTHHDDKFFIPASTAKLLTTAAALSKLGANYRIHTPVYGLGKPPNLTYLMLEGRGDPTISTQSLKNIVRVLRTKGIEHIENLIVKDSYLPPPGINPTWEWSDVYSYYGASVTSLILNENSLSLRVLPQQLGQKVKLEWSDAIAARQWRVENNATTAPQDTPYNLEVAGVLGEPTLTIRGELAINEPPDIWSLAIADPQQYFLDKLRHLLNIEGITVAKATVDNDRQNIAASKITTIVSPPLGEIIIKINRDSNNLYAESVKKILENYHREAAEGAIESSLNELGIDSHGYQLRDGSGLSRHNLITPQAVIEVLTAMSRSPLFNTYRNSLATAGINGTLTRRFQETSVQNNLWGKTGTLTGVAALAGYLALDEYEPIVFTIIVNNSERSNQELRRAIDEIVLLLSKFQKC